MGPDYSLSTATVPEHLGIDFADLSLHHVVSSLCHWTL